MTQRKDGLDLSYLEDGDEGPPQPPRSGAVVAEGSLGSFYDKPKAKQQGGKSIGKVEKSMAHMSMQPAPQANQVDMITVDVKCNYAKSSNMVLCGRQLILQFDKHGIAKMPVHQMALLQQVQRARPGRFTIIPPTPPVSVPQKVEVVVPQKVEAPKSKFEAAPKKKAAKKNQAKPSKPAKKRGSLVEQATKDAAEPKK